MLQGDAASALKRARSNFEVQREAADAQVLLEAAAAAEVVVGLAIIVALLRKRPGTTADDAALLEG